MRALALYYGSAARIADGLQPLLGLVARLFVAQVFFNSGLTKVADWSITVALFENEYQVPLLSPEIAAALGTAGELTLPVLLALGLGTRFAAVGLFVVNLVAVISYPEITDAGIKDHILWGAILAGLLAYGAGKLSIDHWLGRRYAPQAR
jgi:putative oxidoreductase